MCSIISICGEEYDAEAFQKGFSRTKSRGPDDTRVIGTGKGLLGFHRLSIMGLHPEGMQPFSLEGDMVICNGEIYGFEKIREQLKEKGYTFESDSDCEVLLPMWREYGVDMFAMLDAEYALVIYDKKSGGYIAARDPIGIRPLYYGFEKNGAPVFASEPKTLWGLPIKSCPSLPGTTGRTANSSAITI